MRLGMHNGVQLYMCGKCHSAAIFFPSVEIYFCFNHSYDSATGLKRQNGRRFKIF
jgi:hypothetical protein